MIRLLYFMLGASVTMSILTYAITRQIPHSLGGAGALLLAIIVLELNKKATR